MASFWRQERVGAEVSGLPAIAALVALNAAIATWQVSAFLHAAEARQAQQIAQANLRQAERYMAACIESQPFSIGDRVYLPRTVRTTLLVADVPEMEESK